MPEDVNARIVVAVESAAARQNIDNVKKGLNGITDARTKDLKIAQAKSRMELAEHESMIAAQKAYNAELQLEKEEKKKLQMIKRGASIRDIKRQKESIEQLRGEVLKLQQAEAAANLQAHHSKVVYDDLLNPVNEATDGTKKLTFVQIAARAAGRALGIELSGTSTAMLQLGIIAAGAAAAVKLVKFAYDNWREGFAEAAELEHRNSESILEATDRLSERIEKEKEAIKTVEELGNKQNRSVDETVELSRAIRTLGGDFVDLAKSAGIATGGVADFSDISAAAAKRQYERKLKQLQATYNQLRADEDTETQRRDTAGISAWWLLGVPAHLYGVDSDLRIGGEDEIKESQEKINEIAEKRLEILRKIHELKQSEIERLKDQEVKEKAIVSVSNKNIDRRLEDLENQRKIQSLMDSGLEREAEILKIRNQLDKEALSLKGKELEIFNSRRAEIEKSMLASYDQKAAEKARQEAERAEKERLRAAERAEKERLQAAERTMKAEENAYKSLYDRIFSYRQTVQKAITSNSAEGIALQSRIFMNTSVSMTDNPAKQTAANTKDMLKKLTDMQGEIRQLKTALVSSGVKMNVKTYSY